MPMSGGRQKIRKAVLLMALVVVQAFELQAQPTFPKPTGMVNDFAGVLDDTTKSELETLLTGLKAQTTAEVAVVTVNSLGGMSVEEYANRLFNGWGIGRADKNNGILILVAPT